MQNLSHSQHNHINDTTNSAINGNFSGSGNRGNNHISGRVRRRAEADRDETRAVRDETRAMMPARKRAKYESPNAHNRNRNSPNRRNRNTNTNTVAARNTTAATSTATQPQQTSPPQQQQQRPIPTTIAARDAAAYARAAARRNPNTECLPYFVFTSVRILVLNAHRWIRMIELRNPNIDARQTLIDAVTGHASCFYGAFWLETHTLQLRVTFAMDIVNKEYVIGVLRQLMNFCK